MRRTLDMAGLVLMAVALAALEIGLKEAPKHGWARCACSACLPCRWSRASPSFVARLGRSQPIVDLRALPTATSRIGCWL